MVHVAIMDAKRKLIPKILAGEKTIESRWYKMRVAPWNRICAGENIYFKDAGKPVTAMATVERVLQLDHPDKKELRNVIDAHGGNPGICFWLSKDDVFAWAKDRPHVILLFLKDAKAIKPFHIDKSGFGNACAWLTMESIEERKRPVV